MGEFENSGDDVEVLAAIVDRGWSAGLAESWTEIGTDALPAHKQFPTVLSYDGKVWLIGGSNGTVSSRKVYWTTDGTWTEAGTDALPTRVNAHTSLVYDNKMWVIGGYNDDGSPLKKVLWSTDGVTWTEAGTNVLDPGLAFHASVVFDGKMWIFGGWDGTNLSAKAKWSTNGSTWTEAGTNALPSILDFFAAVVFDGKMWIIGGDNVGDDEPHSRKVHWSINGSTWTEAGSNALPVATCRHAAVVYANRMWVLFGDTPGGLTRKAYWSGNGVTWTEAGTDAFPLSGGLETHAAIVTDGMVVVGGYSGSTAYKKLYMSDAFPQAGMTYMDTTLIPPRMKFYDGTVWKLFAVVP